MATNFWESDHLNLLVHRERLVEAHQKDRERGLTSAQIEDVKVFTILYLEDIAKNSQNLIRQRVAATACVYFRRFYLKENFCEYDPRLVGPACLFLACKSEESQVQAKALFQMLKKVSTTGKYHGLLLPDSAQLLDLEMAVLESLEFNLIVYSPYRDLAIFLQDAQTSDLAECAWAVLNDSYRTHVCLLHAPYMVAVACMHVASVLLSRSIESWLKSLNCDLDEVLEIARELMICFKQQRACISTEACNRFVEFVMC
ncbi:g7234 [Coccomyxa elongata]